MSGGGTKTLDRVLAGFGAFCAVLVAADFFVEKHPHFPWEGWFAFTAVFGFASYAFIVVAGGALRKLVMRKEDYYE